MLAVHLLPALYHRIDRRTQVVYVGSTGDNIPCCFQADFVCLLPRSISLVPKVFSVRVALL